MNTLCKKSGAKIVFNTTHNKSFPDVPDVEHCLWRQGLKEEHVVTGVYKTLYPELDRETAVSEWLARHPDVTEWVAFDDARFTEKENLIWVDPDTGLTPFHLNEALEFFGCPPYLIYV
jgi:methionine synthase II (cobalamin-independent)